MTNGNSAERERFEAVYRKRFPNSSSFQDDLFFVDELGEYQETKVFVAFYMWQEALSVCADDDDADAYVIATMGKLLADVALVLKGPQEALKRHSYDDLPDLVRALQCEVELYRAEETGCADGGKGKEVAYIAGDDEYGPKILWKTHWVELIGKSLFTAAIENQIDSQLTASGMDPRHMFRQDGEYVYEAMLAATPASSVADAGGADHEALIAETLHWPDHWDTAAYPDVWSALQEVMHSFQCSECRLEPAAGASERADAEKDAPHPMTQAEKWANWPNGKRGLIYQVFAHRHSMTSCWEDVPKEFYERAHPAQRRIVYDAAQHDLRVSVNDVVLTREQKDELRKVSDDMATEGDEELAECLRSLIACASLATNKDQAEHRSMDAIKAAELEVVKLRADAEKDAALTDAEIAKIWAEHGAKGNAYTFARAILAADKEK